MVNRDKPVPRYGYCPSSRSANEWKVPAHTARASVAAAPPGMAEACPQISWAALEEKLRTKVMSWALEAAAPEAAADARRRNTCANRAASTRVLPVPAPATSNMAGASAAMAATWPESGRS